MKKIILIILSMFLIGTGAVYSQFLVPLYAPGNTGGLAMSTDNNAMLVVGQNAIGETSNADNKVYLGLLSPLSILSTNNDISMSGIIQLHQNYPNPYENRTTIPFEISRAADVQLFVHNVLGQPIETLLDGNVPPGKHLIEYDSKRIKPGLYFYQLKVGNYMATKTMVITE